jgi:putative PIN family toxin of toxin-antitoxin system
MADKSFKIIVDSNIWISFLIGKSLQGLQIYINSNLIKIVTCEEQLQELREVFDKPKIRKYFSKEQILDFFELLDESSEKVNLQTKVKICRDSKDDYLVALAIDSQADYLLTGDYDLLDLVKIQNTNVVKYSEFKSIINSI